MSHRWAVSFAALLAVTVLAGCADGPEAAGQDPQTDEEPSGTGADTGVADEPEADATMYPLPAPIDDERAILVEFAGTLARYAFDVVGPTAATVTLGWGLLVNDLDIALVANATGEVVAFSAEAGTTSEAFILAALEPGGYEIRVTTSTVVALDQYHLIAAFAYPA